jgi:hypothetical protein
MGSMIVDDTGFVIIKRKIVTINVPNILDDNEELKVTINHYNEFILLINIGLVSFFHFKNNIIFVVFLL